MVSRKRLGVLAVVAVAALGLSACSAGSDSAESSSAKAPQHGYGPPGTPAPQADTAGEESAAAVAGERSVTDQPISTFAVDVDTASYGFAKRQLLDGRRPSPSTIRPEEFVNAFNQGYRQPTGNGFAITADGTRLPRTHRDADDAARLLRVGLQTRDEPAGERRDAALTIVVDVSGSMAEPGKLDLVRHGLHTLADELRSSDSVALVAYSNEAEVLRPMTGLRDRDALHSAIGRLRVAGSTNLEAGLRLGYDTARKSFRDGATNRVILLSDGLPNAGTTDAAALVREVREAAAKQITLLGVGVGSDYGDRFMEQLADKGDGYVVYVSEREEAARVFVQQLPATLAVRALDAKAQVEFDPKTVISYRLIGYDNRALSASAFRNDKVDGGEVGPGHAVTALYALHLRPGAEGHLADVRVRWQDPRTREASEQTQPVTVAALDEQFAEAAVPVRVCYATAYFAEVLRGSRFAREVRLGDLLEITSAARRATDDPRLAELSEAISAAVKLYD
ncbi:von Willebrand factor type A domain-containing protein [Dactylosporangium roseum]|uniref:von Willebrand factor type A domain-containing protein n=1 Tax=Dactylosporangium roseum TaxID=47989 RepID=A0ABY5Z6U8_9ACTN|nr:von Willebrand factor type A domain-containing protein [Dactylosporangium roseum]UWZ36750.1 von Willebrand factor type A domain-containing protein [Dactylosporangium roseum]